MDNPEKQATRRRQTKQKHNTICFRHHYMQTNTNKVNKTLTIVRRIPKGSVYNCSLSV